MAGELKLTFGLALTNGNLKDSVATEQITVNSNSSVLGMVADVYTVTNTQTNVDLSKLTTFGFVYLKNLSVGTDFLDYGPISGTTWLPLGQLKAGESTQLRLKPGITLRWVGNSTASVGNANTQKILIRAYND